MSLSRQQITLLGIFALFFGPLLLVMLMRSSWWQYQPSGMKNQGYLVQPPVSLSIQKTPEIEGKWLILYVLDQPCGSSCVDSVTALRQVHRATGRRSENLAIGLLNPAQSGTEVRSKLESIYPKFNFFEDSTNSASVTLKSVNASLPPESGDARTYILDPNLNVILAYSNNADPTDIHKDLKRLLKWSDQEGS